ncbi:MAG: rhamnogalacturonan acetylesterase [Christensenellaceae bacterium]|nr:rhamnogalacturonan acetylesterase [Christensenellaceae bacterium]
MTLYLCGDSTAAAYAPERAPICGWGQVLGELIPGVTVVNAAMPGRSTKSFLSEGRLKAIEREIRPGDLMLIQFGHNDGSDLVWRHTDPYTSYFNNLSIFVDTARLCGAVLVLLTPICRRNFVDGRLTPTHGDYPDAVRLLAAQRSVPLIDMCALSHAHVSSLGEEASRALFMHVEPGVYPDYPDGCTDNTHTRRAGAEAWARMVAAELRRLGLIAAPEVN